MAPVSRYLRPTSLDEALAAARRRWLHRAGRRHRRLSGPGRLPCPTSTSWTSPRSTPCAASAADAPAGASGALVTWSDVLAADLPPLFAGLQAAAAEVGGRQIQNAGTLVGNLCNASPAADGAPVLLAMDASIELTSASGRRVLPLRRLPPRQPRAPPCAPTSWRPRSWSRPRVTRPSSRFLKLGARRYLVISIVMVAVVLEIDAGRIARAGIAIGACGPIGEASPSAGIPAPGPPARPGAGRPRRADRPRPARPDRRHPRHRRLSPRRLPHAAASRVAGQAA